MDWMELSREATKLDRDFQYLKRKVELVNKSSIYNRQMNISLSDAYLLKHDTVCYHHSLITMNNDE